MDKAEARNNNQPRDTVSTIGSGVTITGEVGCTTDLQIEGRVTGDVRCVTLIIGETGVIEGNVNAERVRVSGKLDGAVVAGDLAVEATGKVKGEITYSRLKMTAGGIIEGTLKHRAGEESVSEGANLKLVEPVDPPASAAPAAAAQPRRVYID